MTGYKQRATICFFIFLILFFIAFVRLVIVQVRDHLFYIDAASKQHISVVSSYAPRAHILDRYGKQLAFDIPAHSAFITPLHMHNRGAVESFLASHFPAALDALRTHEQSPFLFVRRWLSQQELALVEASGLQDIHLLHETQRYYPLMCATPLVGMVTTDGIGIAGLEMVYQDRLAGVPATYRLYKDARRQKGYYFDREIIESGVVGSDLHTTLDSQLQLLVHQEVMSICTTYHATQAAALVLEPKTGDLLALVSVPCANPHDRKQMEPELMRALAVACAFELGSVIKVSAALAALAENVVTLYELIDCQNTKQGIVAGRAVNTVKEAGVIPFIDVIATSNNIGIALVAQRLGTRLFDHYKKMGFGAKTGIGLPGEHAGYVAPPSVWSKHSLISLSYGYEVSVTLLQLAQFFSMIANRGTLVSPRITQEKKSSVASIYSPELIDQVREILLRTTRAGTARRAAVRGYQVLCKTGTANDLISGIYDQEKQLYTCAGIVEKGEYQRVIVVFVKHVQRVEGQKLYASTVAAPLFERIAERMIVHDRAV